MGAGSGGAGLAVEEVDTLASVGAALRRLGLPSGRPVLVSIGGASGMQPQQRQALKSLLRDHLLAVLKDHGAAVIDGGTDAGVMRVMGQVLAKAGFDVPLIGVAAVGTVRVPGRPSSRDDAPELEPRHTAVLLVPGAEWGDESVWISRVASHLADGAPTATLLFNGGEIAYSDVLHSIKAHRPVIVVSGSGRTADAIAAALHGDEPDPRAVHAARSGLVSEVGLRDGPGAARLLSQLLAESLPAGPG
jgi:hypothetical protein